MKFAKHLLNNAKIMGLAALVAIGVLGLLHAAEHLFQKPGTIGAGILLLAAFVVYLSWKDHRIEKRSGQKTHTPEHAE